MKIRKKGKAIWLVILLIAGIVLVFISQADKAAEAGLVTAEKQTQREARKIFPVKIGKLAGKTFAGTISVYGKIEARHSAFVSPRISGTIEEIMVEEGDYVEKDKTVLFKSENIKLEQKVRVARQNLAIVRAVEKERSALLHKAEVDLERKEKSFKRYQSLFGKQAVSQEAFDNVEAAYLTAVAELEQKKAFYNLGLEEAKQAMISLEMAEKDFADSTVVAPISGFICERLLEKGEMGQPGKAVFKIENTEDLEISAFVPAEFSGSLSKDHTEAEVSLYGRKLDEKLKITYVSPVVDEKLHIFEVKCRLASASSQLKPGQSVQLKFTFDQRSVLAAPANSLVKSDETWVVFVPQASGVRKISVEKGEEKEGWTEISATDLSEGMPVVTEGQAFLRDNAQIKIIE